MAVITKLQFDEKTGGKRHPTDVVGFYRVLERDGYGPLLQIDTRGSEQRAKRDKQSQTIQFDSNSAKELWLILGKEFGFKP